MEIAGTKFTGFHNMLQVGKYPLSIFHRTIPAAQTVDDVDHLGPVFQIVAGTAGLRTQGAAAGAEAFTAVQNRQPLCTWKAPEPTPLPGRDGKPEF